MLPGCVATFPALAAWAESTTNLVHDEQLSLHYFTRTSSNATSFVDQAYARQVAKTTVQLPQSDLDLLSARHGRVHLLLVMA